MVIQISNRRCGALMTELLIAMALLTGTLLPIAYSVASEKRLARSSYMRAVAMEIVDGEMEILAAGEWRGYDLGKTNYYPHAISMTNLPPGRFELTVQTNKLRLEWLPSIKWHGGTIAREISLR